MKDFQFLQVMTISNLVEELPIIRFLMCISYAMGKKKWKSITMLSFSVLKPLKVVYRELLSYYTTVTQKPVILLNFL